MPNDFDAVRALVKLAMCSGDHDTCEYFNTCTYSKFGTSCAKVLRRDNKYVLSMLPPAIASATGKKRDVSQQIYDVLFEFSIPATILGYEYLHEAIATVVKDQSVIHGVTKILYPSIAKHFATTPIRVERSMRHAIELAWSRADIDVLTKYFGYIASLKSGRPTVSEFIATVADNIRHFNKDY